MCVTGEAPGGALDGELPVRLPATRGEELGASGKGMCLRAGADNILEFLGPSLPEGFPSESFSTAVGPEACAVDAPPLSLRFFPPPPPPPSTWAPPGTCVHSYTHDSRHFAVHQWQPATSPDLAAYLSRMTCLAMWLIENASPLDLSDSRWTVLTTYEVPAPAPAAVNGLGGEGGEVKGRGGRGSSAKGRRCCRSSTTERMMGGTTTTRTSGRKSVGAQNCAAMGRQKHSLVSRRKLRA